MANIALNKPSGGQLILSPEDGTSTETVTIPSVGVGKVLQVQTWRLSPIGVSTAGGFTSTTTPTRASLYQVYTNTFNKKSPTSKLIFQASGSVDVSSSSLVGATIVSLLDASDTIVGSAYMHVQYRNTEPYPYCFAGEYNTTDMNPTFYLCCHSNGGESMWFSRMYSSSLGQTPYTITIMEVAA